MLLDAPGLQWPWISQKHGSVQQRRLTNVCSTRPVSGPAGRAAGAGQAAAAGNVVVVAGRASTNWGGQRRR
jgi:hypothetical protein